MNSKNNNHAEQTRSVEQDLETLGRAIQDAPAVKVEFNALAVFNLIGLLQFASRGLPPDHNQRKTAVAYARQFQQALKGATGGSLDEIIEAGFDPAHDVIETGDGLPIVEVHNCWTIYGANPDGSKSDNKIASFERPQDWGHPRWAYNRFRFEWTVDGKHYINNAHCWTDIPGVEPGGYPELFASLIVRVMMPGHEEQLCGRDYLHPEDFWSQDWGEMPPIYEPEEEGW